MKTENHTLAIFGGTFNPIHLGHLSIAESVKREYGYRQILMIPSSIPAHKDVDPFTGNRDRIAMLELAIDGIDYLTIDTCEIDRGGISYMIETVDYVNNHYTFTGNPGLIIGDDLLSGFLKWRHVDELAEKVDIIVARRLAVKETEFCFPHVYLNNRIVEAASRDIREMASRGERFDDYVPARVSHYIEEHHLYRRS